MSYQDVLAMPLRGFWMLSAQVTRVRAEEALEMLDLFLLANANCDPETGSEALRKELLKRLGEPVKVSSPPGTVDPDQHEKGISELKNLLGM